MSLQNELSVNLALPERPLTQNAELFTELNRVYNAIRSVARSLDAYTGVVGEQNDFWSQAGALRCNFGLNSKIYLEAGEDLILANTIGIKADGQAWKAVDGGTRCRGFCTAVNGVLAGEFVEFQVFGIYPQFSAGTLTPGSTYYQSGSAGQVGASGSQAVGFAITDRILFFNPTL